MPPAAKHIALFGGSFNPPHRGHLQVLRHLQKKKTFDEIWLLPTASHPFGKTLLPFATRKHLLQLLLQDLGRPHNIHIKTIEQTLYRRSKKPNRTIDTLHYIQARRPTATLTLVLGSDLIPEISQWKNPAGIRKLASLYFLPRKGFAKENRKLKQKPFLPEVYSTNIRKNLKASPQNVRGLSPRVARYLVAKEIKF